MVHGWPSLWSSWGHQIEHFKVIRIVLQPALRRSRVRFSMIIAWWPLTSAVLEGPRTLPTFNRRAPWLISQET